MPVLHKSVLEFVFEFSNILLVFRLFTLETLQLCETASLHHNVVNLMVNDHCIGHKHIIFLQEEESVEEEQPVEIQLEELVEIIRTNEEKCEFTVPVMIAKIEQGKIRETNPKDVEDESSGANQELGKIKNDSDTSLGTLNISATNDIERNNTSENQLSKMPENNSETTTRERISPMNETITEATENTKRAAKKSVETARVIEGIDILGTEKCSCTATDQVPVLVLDKLKKNGNFEKMNEEVEVKIFKAELDLGDSSSNSDPEVNDKRNEIPRDKPFR